MFHRICLVLMTVLLSASAEESKEENQLILRQPVITTFYFNGNHLRIWSVDRNESYIGISEKDWRFFYDPVLVPFLNTDNQISVMPHQDPSSDLADRQTARIVFSTNNSEVHHLACNALKIALGKDVEIRGANVQPLPILKLDVTLPGLSKDLANSHKHRSFKKTFESPGPTVELVLTTDSDKTSKDISELLENIHISYSMDLDVDTTIRQQVATCINGKVQDFGTLKGRVNLRELKLLQQVHVQSQQCLTNQEQLLKAVEVKEDDLKNALSENNDLKKKDDEHQTNIKKMRDMITDLLEDKEQLQTVIRVKEEELKNERKENNDLIEQTLKDIKLKQEILANAQRENNDLKEQLQKTVRVGEESLKNAHKEISDLKEKLQNATKWRLEHWKMMLIGNNYQKEEHQSSITKMQEKIVGFEEYLKIIKKRVGCGPGWTHMCFLDSCSCYRLFDTMYKSWEDASKTCRSLDSELASVHSDEENAYLGKLANSSLHCRWIGLNDRSREGLFQWSDGTRLDFTFWSRGQPESRKADKNCVITCTYDLYKWQDWACSAVHPYICKHRL